jgi:hypothetical protein
VIIKEILHEPDGLGMHGVEFVDLDRLMVDIAGMEEFDAERQFIGGPQGMIVPELDLAEFIVGEILGPQDGGKIGAGGVKGGMGTVQGALRHVVQIDLGGFSAKTNGPGQTAYQYKPQDNDVPHWE